MRGFLSEIRRRGYALLPVPQNIVFGEGNLKTTHLSREPRSKGVTSDGIAARELRDALFAAAVCLSKSSKVLLTSFFTVAGVMS